MKSLRLMLVGSIALSLLSSCDLKRHNIPPVFEVETHGELLREHDATNAAIKFLLAEGHDLKQLSLQADSRNFSDPMGVVGVPF